MTQQESCFCISLAIWLSWYLTIYLCRELDYLYITLWSVSQHRDTPWTTGMYSILILLIYCLLLFLDCGGVVMCWERRSAYDHNHWLWSWWCWILLLKVMVVGLSWQALAKLIKTDWTNLSIIISNTLIACLAFSCCSEDASWACLLWDYYAL